MDNNKTDFWHSFFCALPELTGIIKPYAERSGISSHSAILLMVYSEFPEIDIPVRDEFIEELKVKGLIKTDSVKPVVTSKGAILAKAFIGVRKASFN